MDSVFLILVAVPLGIFVIVMLWSMRGIGQPDAETASALPLAERVDTSIWLDEQDEPSPLAELEVAASTADLPEIPAPLPTPIETAVADQTDAASNIAPTSAAVAAPALESNPAANETQANAVAEAVSETTAESAIAEPAVAKALPESSAAETLAETAVAEAVALVETSPESNATETVTAQDEIPQPASELILETDAKVIAVPTESVAAVETPAAEITEPLAAQSTPDSVLEESAAAETKETLPSTVVEIEPDPEDANDPILPEGPVQLPPQDSPKYAFDYRGRLWVEKKNKGFFRQLRRPQLPPDDPSNGR